MTQAATTEPEIDPRSPRVRLAAFFDGGEFTAPNGSRHSGGGATDNLGHFLRG